ncbi:hypothetical protein L873DRAFT_1937761 [Choiromyces venosus 120613-1]|uniref:Uncharacterized protein n=1 Tax=Choiromyces venosus 120613-1 TaxID=1336337 RepID=A0A3N4IQC1_9PEZI|nr:hypothetical protein L873DRAFT_1937761 [Choiromyces venosus 120613-1]
MVQVQRTAAALQKEEAQSLADSAYLLHDGDLSEKGDESDEDISTNNMQKYKLKEVLLHGGTAAWRKERLWKALVTTLHNLHTLTVYLNSMYLVNSMAISSVGDYWDGIQVGPSHFSGMRTTSHVEPRIGQGLLVTIVAIWVILGMSAMVLPIYHSTGMTQTIMHQQVIYQTNAYGNNSQLLLQKVSPSSHPSQEDESQYWGMHDVAGVEFVKISSALNGMAVDMGSVGTISGSFSAVKKMNADYDKQDSEQSLHVVEEIHQCLRSRSMEIHHV